MHYRQLAEVSTYIHSSSHRLNEILQMLCIKALSPLSADALVYAELDNNGYTVPQSSFGLEFQDTSGLISPFHLSERTPFTDAIRDNKIVVVNSLPIWPKQYSALKKLDFPAEFKSLITSPVEVEGLPIGSLAIFSHVKLELEDELSEFIDAISIILSGALKLQDSILSHSSSSNHSENSSRASILNGDADKTLTERQLLIMKLIAEGRTNAAIADVLGYSESLIRQETIKIYAKLNCSGRSEAAQAYYRLELNKESAAI